MIIKEELRLIARQATEKLEDQWSIGKFSSFCDERDYDTADSEEIIKVLLPFLQKAYELQLKIKWITQ